MLQKEMRKKLTNQNWEYVAKHDANPSQTFTRFKSQVDHAFNDFEVLLGAKFPEDKEELLFSAGKIRRLAEALVRGSDGNGLQYPTLQRRRSQLALILAEVGLKFLISQYSILSKRTPFLSQTAINELERTIQICRDISEEIQSISIESGIQKEKTVHIFDWNSVPGKHERRLRDFLFELIKIKEGEDTLLESFKVKKDEYNRKLECRIRYAVRWQYPDGEEDSDEYIYNAVIEIQSKKRALLSIKEEGVIDEDKIKHKQELLVIEDRNDLHIMNIE